MCYGSSVIILLVKVHIEKLCYNSFQGFEIPLEVQNYPMQKRSRSEIDELSRAMATRRIEMAEAKSRAELVEIPVPKPSQAAVCVHCVTAYNTCYSYRRASL